MADGFYSKSLAGLDSTTANWFARPMVAYALLASILLHLLGSFVFPYLNELAPVPPPVSLIAELLPPPVEAKPPQIVTPPSPPVSKLPVVREPPPVMPPRITPPPEDVPPPKPVLETAAPVEPLPVAPAPVAQPDIVAQAPASELIAPQAVSSVTAPVPVPTPPVQLAPALPVPTPLTNLTAMPMFRIKVQPVYPSQNHTQGKEATVKLDVLLDERGKPVRVTVTTSAGKAFDDAAVAAMWASEFEPGRVGSRAVAVIYRVPITFRLR